MGLMDRVLSTNVLCACDMPMDYLACSWCACGVPSARQVVEALRPYGLTLQNYASVREQQIGGFIQVSASLIQQTVLHTQYQYKILSVSVEIAAG